MNARLVAIPLRSNHSGSSASVALPDASLTRTDLSGNGVNRELSSRGSLKKRAHLWDDQSTVTMIFLKAAGFSLQDRRATAASSSGTTKLTA